MSNIMKIRLLAMVDSELKQVVGMISDEALWAHGATNEEEAQMHVCNIMDLEEYRDMLLRMREQVVEEEFNV